MKVQIHSHKITDMKLKELLKRLNFLKDNGFELWIEGVSDGEVILHFEAKGKKR